MSGGIVTKVCSVCNIEKPVGDFYKRSGSQNPNNPSYWLSHCRECMVRATSRGPSNHVSHFASENRAISYLESNGISACRGPVANMPLTDVCALGRVGVEVKYLRRLAVEYPDGTCSLKFVSALSPQQIRRGFLAHVVLVVLPQFGGDTYHVLPTDSPFLLKPDGARRRSLQYYPAPRRPLTAKSLKGVNDLLRNQDNLALIWDTYRKLGGEG